VIEALGDAPDYHALPVGNAGNISAHWMGYSEAVGKNTATCSHCDGDCKYLAKPIATPTAHNARLPGHGRRAVSARCDGGRAETIATAIRIGHPVSWKLAWRQKRIPVAGSTNAPTKRSLRAQKLLAEKEGIFCEPASGLQ